MTAPAVELGINRLNTKAFIDARYTNLVLTPRVRSMTGTGTSFTNGDPKPSQRVRIIDQSTARGPQPGTILTADGKQRKVEYQLLGEYTADFALNDTWVDEAGIRWEIGDILPFNGYERRALVVRYGE